jgi:hypothetical protein
MQREGLYIGTPDLSTFTVIVADNPKNTKITTTNRRKSNGYRGCYDAQHIGTMREKALLVLNLSLQRLL